MNFLTFSIIHIRYRRLALKFHPSNNKEPGSAERFIQLGEAYDVLSNRKSEVKRNVWATGSTCLLQMSDFYLAARKKATYDKFGDEGLKGGIPLDASSTGAWSAKYVYHGKPEKTFTQFFGGNNPFAGEK